MDSAILFVVICILCTEISVVFLGTKIALISSSISNSFNSEEELKKNVLDILSLVCPESLYCEEDISDIVTAAENAVVNGTDEISRSRKFLLEISEEFVPCCSKCSCKPDCHEKRNCCPGGIFNRTYEEGQSLECVPIDMDFRFHGIGEAGPAIYMTTACHSTYSEEESKMKCESPNLDFPDEIIPVHSESSERVYLNVYCALCNFVNDTEMWDMRFVLKGPWYPSAISANSLSFYRSVIQSVRTRRTNVMFSPRHPDKIRSLLEPCVPFIKIIDTCPSMQHHADNSSGNLMHAACELFSSLYKHFRVYKNVFCMTCNIKRDSIDVCKGSHTRAPMQSFTGLLDFSNNFPGPGDTPSDTKNSQCNCTEWYDEVQGFCRAVLCPFLERRINCACTRMVTKVSGIQVDIRINVRIMEGRSNTLDPDNLKESFLRRTVSALIMYLNSFFFKVHGFEAAYLCSSESGRFLYFIIKMNNYIDYDLRDQVEALLNDLWNYPVVYVGQVKVQLYPGPRYDNYATPGFIGTERNYTYGKACKKLDLPGVLKRHGIAVNALLYCKTIKILPDELELLANTSVQFRSFDKTYLSYIYDKTKSVMCFDDFVKFVSGVSNGLHFQDAQNLKLLSLTVQCIMVLLNPLPDRSDF